ncbi:MAG: hypothetical protein ACJ75B_09980 [Flavisolibacter sp.]
MVTSSADPPIGEAAIGISNKLFDLFDPSEGDLIPNDIIGSEIIAIGTPVRDEEDDTYYEGELIIEYRTKEGSIKRLHLQFNELAMWTKNLSP